MKAIGAENQRTKKEIDAEWAAFLASSHPIKLCITNANSGSAYAMIKAACSGEVFGADTEVSLCLLGSDSDLETLAGTEMEAFDLALPLLRKIHITSDPHEAFNDCSVIVIFDEVVKNEEEERELWLRRNAEHFINYAKIINDASKPDVRVIIAGDGPLNFIASMMVKNAPRVPRQNIVACPRQFENEVKATLAQKLGVNSAGIVNTIIWGNINGSHIIDIEGARVHGYDGAIWGPPSFSIPVQEMIHDKKWLETEFYEVVAKHKVSVETMLNHPKSMSQGAAVATLLNHWWTGSPEGHVFSLGILSEGAFDIPEGLVFSCPVNFSCPGYWTVVQDSTLSPENQEKIRSIIKEIQSDEQVIYPKAEEKLEETVPQEDNAQENLENEKIFGEESLEKIKEEKEEKEEEKSEEKDKSSRPHWVFLSVINTLGIF
ncbi:hypothetical protein CAPTEDRAFT_150393 [Capitella teleta]|uniref:Malate dehydrogenase, cytoplasmic n=1 Tax=Capitella teleta TaxID=283909 RepID=R7TB86_CAPTE|nr:hypothetical protein CAPTEDRAFT_150393 [Capitella teleta]|eukprot:ELT90762.1 hypothetical protein CAPTEDRAFT_150393 [Capitella teleta]